jgi:hypothetical protein
VTGSEEEPDKPFIELFSDAVMGMSYLYSKLPETGVSSHIGTGGSATTAGVGADLNKRRNLIRSVSGIEPPSRG